MHKFDVMFRSALCILHYECAPGFSYFVSVISDASIFLISAVSMQKLNVSVIFVYAVECSLVK